MRRLLHILVALAMIGAVPAHAADRGASFSSQEVEIITRYYHETTRQTGPPGRGNRLPRGIARNLARGKTLPPGIAKRGLPPELVRLLPPPPQGYERLVVAGKILLIETATQVVHDVLTDVLFR